MRLKSELNEDSFGNHQSVLQTISPESWNNIALPVVNAIKILRDELNIIQLCTHKTQKQIKTNVNLMNNMNDNYKVAMNTNIEVQKQGQES